jgi:hypothetical protein
MSKLKPSFHIDEISAMNRRLIVMVDGRKVREMKVPEKDSVYKFNLDGEEYNFSVSVIRLIKSTVKLELSFFPKNEFYPSVISKQI